MLAVEAPSAAAAVWRFRLVGLLLLALLALGVVLAFLHFSGVTAEDPGLSGALSRAVGGATLR